MGKLRLRKVQSLAQVRVVLSELCGLGMLLGPQLQQSKVNDLSAALDQSNTVALFHWVGQIETYSCPSPSP